MKSIEESGVLCLRLCGFLTDLLFGERGGRGGLEDDDELHVWRRGRHGGCGREDGEQDVDGVVEGAFSALRPRYVLQLDRG